jgi:hypothetical protein
MRSNDDRTRVAWRVIRHVCKRGGALVGSLGRVGFGVIGGWGAWMLAASLTPN